MSQSVFLQCRKLQCATSQVACEIFAESFMCLTNAPFNISWQNLIIRPHGLHLPSLQLGPQLHAPSTDRFAVFCRMPLDPSVLRNDLREEDLILTHGFTGLSPWSLRVPHLWTHSKMEHRGKGCSIESYALMVARKRLGTRWTSKVICDLTAPASLPSCFYLSMGPSYYECSNKFIHRLCHSLQNPVISPDLHPKTWQLELGLQHISYSSHQSRVIQSTHSAAFLILSLSLSLI